MSRNANVRLLDMMETTGDGSLFNLIVPQFAAAIQAEIFGSPTQCVINLLALLDGSTFDTLSVLDITNGYTSGKIIQFPEPRLFRQVKGNVSALTSGCAVSLYLSTRE